MREKFPMLVERKRFLRGVYASAPLDKYGAFLLKTPKDVELTVIVSDGSDWAPAGLAGPAWEHVSVSTIGRCPTWEEMCWVKNIFWDDAEWVVQYHPAKSDYVNCHPHTLHLWRPVSGDFPRPPGECV